MIINKLLGPSRKFVVSSKTNNTTFGPGTTGYISHTRGFDTDFPNVVYVSTAIIRRGKTGKERLDSAVLSIPLIEIEDENQMAKLLPDDKRKDFVRIEADVDNLCTSIKDIPDVEFVGLVCSTAMFFDKVLRSLVSLDTIESKYKALISKYACLPAEGADLEKVKQLLCSPPDRISIIKNFRYLENLFSKCIREYRSRVSGMQADILEALKKIDVNEKELSALTSIETGRIYRKK